jgi:response regulator RpfG family c-di-GMP phosphodiesterase
MQTDSDTLLPPILVVDDEELVLAAVRETLRQAHYDVLTLSDPLAALAELKKQEFSVIITDQRMPSLSGLELLAQARQLQPNATRILITAVLNLDTVVQAINQGEIYRFIVKPWLREEFLTSVHNGQQRYELLRQNERLQATTQTMNQQLLELNRSLEQQVQLGVAQNQQLTALNQALEDNFQRSLELCVHTMETFEPWLGAQARQAVQLCQAMAQALQLAPEERRLLESSARIYDIGLLGTSRGLIRRWQTQPTELNEAEQALLQQHPALSQELAGFGSGLEKVGAIIRAHHERMDGTGYPDRLAGAQIPWLARLLAVAVAYVSSPSPAPLEEIQTAADSAFDSEAVRVLLRALPLMATPRKEKAVLLTDLRPGMVLASGVYSSHGLLLLPEGQRLNTVHIEKLRNHHRLQPLTASLAVYC